MTFMISTTLESTGMASSARTAARAMAWIHDRRVAGACRFCIVDSDHHEISESELAHLAWDEAAEPVWLEC
jgi:hypothetical protein